MLVLSRTSIPRILTACLYTKCTRKYLHLDGVRVFACGRIVFLLLYPNDVLITRYCQIYKKAHENLIFRTFKFTCVLHIEHDIASCTRAFACLSNVIRFNFTEFAWQRARSCVLLAGNNKQAHNKLDFSGGLFCCAVKSSLA